MFSLGDSLSCVGLGWPARPRFLKGVVAWAERDLDGLPAWLLNTNPDEWEATNFSWCPPVVRVKLGLQLMADATTSPKLNARAPRP